MSVNRRRFHRGFGLAESPVNWQNPLTNGIVSWWMTARNFGYGTPTWRSLTGRNNGSLVNNPAWQGAKGRRGGSGSLWFNGDNVHVLIPSNTAMSFSRNFTLLGWFLDTNVGAANHGLISRSGGGPYVRISTDGQLYFLVSQTAAVGPAVTILSSNVWYHGGVTVSAGATATVAFYLNGKADGTQSTAEAMTGGTDWYLAIDAGAVDELSGYMDDWVVWDRALSAAEIAAWYNQSARGHPDALKRIARPQLGATAALPAEEWALRASVLGWN